MNQQQWEALGFEVRTFGLGTEGYVKVLPNGNEITVTNEEDAGSLPVENEPLLIALYHKPASEDTDCFAYVTMGSNFSSNPLDNKYIIAVINALIETMR